MDKAESMQHQACIPDSWWEFAFAHATYIYNHTLVARLNWHTPYELFKGVLPNIDHLHIFGCGAFAYLLALARANEMAFKSELMTYISVAPGNEHNFLFMHSTNAVFTAAHAVFNKCVKSRSSLDDSSQFQDKLQGGGIGRVLLWSRVVGRGSGDQLDSMTGSQSIDPLHGF